MALPLPTLTFYRMPDQSPAAATIVGLVDAIYAALGSATDYRGTALPASHQWVVSRYQNVGISEAVYLTGPAGSPMTLLPGLILAGNAAASGVYYSTPPDTGAANQLAAGVAKSCGAWNAWTAAQPWVGCAWTGLSRCCATAMNAVTAVVRAYVSEEVIVLDMWSSAIAHYPWIGGAICEAHTDDPNCLENDSRLYGHLVSPTALSSTFASGTNGLLDHSTGANLHHGLLFQPGLSPLYAMGRRFYFQIGTVSGNDVDLAGNYIASPILLARSTANNQQGGKPLGRLREVYYGGATQGARTLRDGPGAGANDLFHVVGYDNGNPDDSLWLKAAS